VVITPGRPQPECRVPKEVDVVMNLIFFLIALTVLPLFSRVGRMLLSLLFGLVGITLVMALVIMLLLALASHGGRI
jgi:hypothetical protein